MHYCVQNNQRDQDFFKHFFWGSTLVPPNINSLKIFQVFITQYWLPCNTINIVIITNPFGYWAQNASQRIYDYNNFLGSTAVPPNINSLNKFRFLIFPMLATPSKQ